MNKFLGLLDSIREGAPAPLGFGASKAQKLPGIALISLVSSDHKKSITMASKVPVDAVIIEGVDNPGDVKKIIKPLGSIPWGARLAQLSEGQAQAFQDDGSDLIAFNVEGTAASNLVCDQIARILCINIGLEEDQLRALSSLPVDVFLLSMKEVSSPWGIQDLAKLSVISRRVDKYILLEVVSAPTDKDLEALRDIGINGIIIDASEASAKIYRDLKEKLLNMPRPKHSRREKTRAILPGASFTQPEESQDAEEEEDHDHE